MKKIYFLFLFSVQLAYSQKDTYHSLELKLAATKVDTQKLEIIKQLVDIAFESDIEKALEFSRRGVQLADKIRDKNWQPKFYEMEGRMHANLLHLDSATLFFNKAMTGYKAVDNKRGHYSIRRIAAGAYPFTISAPGYEPVEVTINFVAGMATKGDYELVAKMKKVA